MSSDVLKISKILGQLLSFYGLNESELGRKVNLPRATINRLVSGRTPDPRASTLKAIADYFNISIEQLLGKQPLFTNHHQNIISSKGRPVPIIEWEQAKHWDNTRTDPYLDHQQEWVMVDLDREGHFILRVRDESMWPQFQETTLLIVDPEKLVKNRDFVLVQLNEGENLVFRQLIIEEKERILKAINPQFSPIKMTESDKVLGVVIQTRSSYA